MRNIFTLEIIDQEMKSDFENFGMPDDAYFDRLIPLLDKLDLEPPKRCVNHLLAFSSSYAVMKKGESKKFELILN